MIDPKESQPTDLGTALETFEVWEDLDRIVRHFRKLNRYIGHIDPIPDEIASLIDRYAQLEIGNLDLHKFRQIVFDINDIDECISDTLRHIMETKTHMTVFQERVGEASSEIRRLVEKINEAPAPSLRLAITAAAKLARERSSAAIGSPNQLSPSQTESMVESEFQTTPESAPPYGPRTSKREPDLTGEALVNAEQLSNVSSEGQRTVFVVHGRNLKAKKAMFDFLRTLDLQPIEWENAVKMTNEAAPYVGTVIHTAISNPCAVVVLMTGDDEARVREQFRTNRDSDQLLPQPRLNVVFEAGMAFGLHPTRTLLVELAPTTDLSDIAGRHVVRIGANEHTARNALRTRLIQCGCKVDDAGEDWLSSGDFAAALLEAKGKQWEGEPQAPNSEAGIDTSSVISMPLGQIQDASRDEAGWNGIIPFFRLTSQDGGISSSDPVSLVIGNYGESPAVDVRLDFEDPLITSDGKEISATTPFTRTQRLLKPNEEIVLPIDTEALLSLSWILGKIRSTYRISATARSSTTGTLATSYHTLDLGSVFPFE